MKFNERLLDTLYWNLSRTDANDVFQDYRLMVEDPAFSKHERNHFKQQLCCAAKELRIKKQYRVWLLTFLFLVIVPLCFTWFTLTKSHCNLILIAIFYFGGQGVALFYFRFYGTIRIYRDSIKKILSLVLTEVAVSLGTIGFILWIYIQLDIQAPLIVASKLNHPDIGAHLVFVMQLIGSVLCFFSILGVYRAKVRDDRWIVLYHFGISVLAVFNFIIAKLNAIVLSTNWTLWIIASFFLLIGIILTGVGCHQKLH